ncbi:Hypothetical predicted protein [Paramuricea clavata]|uniref:Uncharacterized protein n=1 Tax=Paramuricea clavata TaxID=317549 RepID=A0A6S7I6I2_PARCT|nr:Hypothetical predicted protein [Paramuricea clavata]
MNIIKKTTEHLHPGQVPVIAVDQPLFAVAKQIQWNWPQTHGEQNFVILLGGLHIEMVALKMLGDWLEDSRWTSALVEAGIANPGMANSFAKALNVKRARCAHQLTASALYALLNKSICRERRRNGIGTYSILRQMKMSRRFSSIAVDQAHKQNNTLVKGDGGDIGLTENPGALRLWMISGPEIARMITEFEDDTAFITDEKTDQAKHHEERHRVQISFAKDVKALVHVMEDMGNPFLEESADLLVLVTRTIADASMVATVHQIEAECLTEEKRSICEPIKKNKYKLFSSPPPKIPSKDKQQIAMLKSDCGLYSRLYIACQTRDGDLDKFFEHENQGCPPSLSQHGNLCLPGNKSDLLQCTGAVIPVVTDSPNSIDVTIIDSAAAINMLKPTPAVKTFHDYAEHVFIPYIKGQLQHTKRFDVVWDEYTPNSLKETRKKRGRGIRRRVQSSTKLPSKWHEFLRVNENMTELFAFLANHILSADFGSNKQVISNHRSTSSLQSAL